MLDGTVRWKIAFGENLFFFAGGCLGMSRAERPSVSWTTGVKDAMKKSTKWMWYIIKTSNKNMQKDHRSSTKPSARSSKPWPISTGAQKEGSGEVPTESTCARVGKMQVDTHVKAEGFGGKGKHLCQSVKYAVVQWSQLKQININEQKASVQKLGG